MKRFRNGLCVLGCVLLAAFFAGCGGSSGDDYVPEVDATGTWSGTTSFGTRFTAVIQQNGASLSGTVNNTSENGSLSGYVDGTTAYWDIVWAGGGTGTYQANVDGNRMSGSATERYDSGEYSFSISATRK